MAKTAAAVLCFVAVASFFAAPAAAESRKLLAPFVAGDYTCPTIGASCSNTAYYFEPVCYSASTCKPHNGGQFCHASAFNDGVACPGTIYAGNPCYTGFSCANGLCYGSPKCGVDSTCNAGTCGPAPTTMVADNEWLYGDNQVVSVYCKEGNAAYTHKLIYKYKGVEKPVPCPADSSKPALLGWIGQFDTVHFGIEVYDNDGNLRDKWWDKSNTYGTAQSKRTIDAGTKGVTIKFEDRRPAEADRPEEASAPKDYNDYVAVVYGLRPRRS